MNTSQQSTAIPALRKHHLNDLINQLNGPKSLERPINTTRYIPGPTKPTKYWAVGQGPSTAAVSPASQIHLHKPLTLTHGRADQIAENAKRHQARHMASVNPEQFAKLPFREAAALWLEAQKAVLRERTHYMYSHHIKFLNVHFADIAVKDIHIGNLIAYQQERSENAGNQWARPAGASLINHEICMIQQIMKRAKLWNSQIGELYTPLPLPSFEAPKVLNDDERIRLFKVASKKTEWALALQVVKITCNTSASGCELRNLTFADVILNSGTPRMAINAGTAKNQYRGRTIALNEEAVGAIQWCMERAKGLGSTRPEQYIFPKRIVRGLWDPDKPASSSWIRVPFDELREAAGLPWLTPHCFRHQFITEALEKGVPTETVRHMAGHVTEEMMRRYSHSRLETQVAALEKMKGQLDPKDSSQRPSKPKSAAVRAQHREFLLKGRRRRFMQRRAV